MKRLTTLALLAGLLASCGESTASGPSALQRAESLLAAGDQNGLSTLLAGPDAAELPEALRVDLEAKLAVAQDDVPKAERLCREYLEAHPGEAGVAYTLTDVYLSIGAGDLAREVIDRTLAANPEACKMHYYSGVLHGSKRRLDKAAEAFQEAERCGFHSPDLEYNLAVLDQNQGRVEESIGRLRELRETQPEWRNVRRELARGLIAKGDQASMDEAQLLLDELSAVIESEIVIDETHDGVGQGDWRVWELLGLHAEKQGDLQAAQLYYVEALKAGENPPQVEEAYLRVSEQLLEGGQSELVPVREENTDLPPISAGMQQRFDEAKKKKQREQQGSESQDDAATDGL
ncbi:MAG: tetratricopeptide repeat protein [Planctomycetes bacterium]|nr:tetratricopeptide repeat protein [Planctomycetota bacterium]MCB9906050.1 tetratricopeptide repeat protein [Planctomycetota bacterium]